ncbi:Xaa-Pro aminopeptidase [Hydrogenovibrio halophilus]|uniref:Xaa-Pro aminopeptidase n=1 Tax=Hydrogenovibrio halophilus TaxID=373391 RepID=UPI00039AD628|nr:Xaa-Pro aminopeptidase [Hydrogenovibrio halophilus]
MIELACQKRQQLFDAMPDNALVLVGSGHEAIRNRDVEYPFRPASDFFYLTGFDEPEACLLMSKKPDAENRMAQRTGMFLRPKDPQQEVWEGKRLGVDMAPDVLKIDQAWSKQELNEILPQWLEGIDSIWLSFEQLDVWQPILQPIIRSLKAQARKGKVAPTQLRDLDGILHEMRLIKSSEEVALIRKAAQVSVQGHLAAMQSVAAQRFEYQLQADMEATFKRHGAKREAFATIVAAGENACVLHYTENRAAIAQGDLVLVDAGAEFEGYAGDITTTFPANGHFSAPQARLYNWVLKAQRAAIDCIAPGVSYFKVHETARRILVEGLVDCGILQGDLDELIEAEAFKPYFMHGTSHWLGMDVHDVGAYKQSGVWRELEPGMVLTVEPGLYIAPDSEVPEAYQGIGIRIEDDVVVTENGHENLTLGLPRTVTEIEQWMQANAGK